MRLGLIFGAEKISEQIKTNFYLLKHILQKNFLGSTNWCAGHLGAGGPAVFGVGWGGVMPELHFAKRRVPCSARDQT